MGGGGETPHSVESKDSNICHTEPCEVSQQSSRDVSYCANIQHDNALSCHTEPCEVSQNSQRDVWASPQHDKNLNPQYNNLSCHSEGDTPEESQRYFANPQYDNTIEPDIVLDFFAGSGTTAHAVLELNREDGGKRKFILVTNNEKTSLNPNGIAEDVTAKRLKRIMSGQCYSGDSNFKWIEKNKPYGDSLEVSRIESLSPLNEKIFEEIDERLYGLRFDNAFEKIKWVCENFDLTQKELTMQGLSEGNYEARLKAKKDSK